MAKKATKAQIEQRVRMVYEMLLLDTPYIDIVRYVAKNWDVKSRMADNYIRKANVLIVKEAAQIRKNALEKHLTQRAFIRNKALKKGDERLAFDVLRDETKLLDLYPSTRHSVTGNVSIETVDMSSLSEDQLKRLAAGDDIKDILVDQ